MPLTPTDVIDVTFGKASLGKRGYAEPEVDAFLDLVKAELTRLIQENNALHTKLDLHQRVALPDDAHNLRPPESPQPAKTPVPPTTMEQISPGGGAHGHAAKMLGLAQETANRLAGDAKAEAGGMLGEARVKSEKLISDTRTKADNLINQARIQVESLLNEAQAKVEVLDRQSREKAALLEREAAGKHAEIMGSISQEKKTVERRVAELRAFEREYRARLTTYLESQLRELDQRRPGFPAEPIRTQQDLVASG
jgi:DivIVA domain-containing protein